MAATIINGTAIAKEIREKAAEDTAKLVADAYAPPGLATVLIGPDPASEVYVGMKQRTCARLGIQSFGRELTADATHEDVENVVKELNADPLVNGILVQLPLPKHLDEESILRTISERKDIDGFHPLNIGRLAQKGREPLFVPCTPDGCMYLLEKTGIEFEGANAVVLGRSNIVGMPAALLLVKRNAVSYTHLRAHETNDLISYDVF